MANTKGNVEMLAFEDMPFSPHFQYEHLKKTLFKLLANDHDRLGDVKSVGYFGY